MPSHIPLSYQADNAELFGRLQKLPWSIWLDSQGASRWEIMTALPRTTYRWTVTGPHWNGECASELAALPLAPFEAAKALFNRYAPEAKKAPLTSISSPFKGGLLGSWGYDAASPHASDIAAMPAAAFGWYDWFIAIDHELQSAELVFLPGCPDATRTTIQSALSGALHAPEAFLLSATFKAETDQDTYARHIARIQDYILAGDCYQVNYTQAFTARYSGSPWSAYRTLRQQSRSPYSAYLHFPFGDILCLSPEQFIELDQGRITSKPIKGTRPRYPDDPARDAEEAQALLHSEKDLAENVMITDLLRNDLGIHAETGSVKVESLCALESFSLVHHLVSTITANLKSESHPIDLFMDAFPGGSITGAPKKRAMEIIAELEQTPRSVYCGSIGYISADGRMDTNIAIRTLVCKDGQIRAWAGGGITIGSRWQDEYQECFNKIGGLLKTLEALGKAGA